MDRYTRKRLLKKVRKNEIIEYLLKFCDKELGKDIYHNINNERWTIVDLFIRKYLNIDDGFKFTNIENIYNYLLKIKKELIDLNLLSKESYDNFGFILWENYNFENNAKNSINLDEDTFSMLINEIQESRKKCNCC